MKRIRSATAVLATLLAALLPLEQAHCAWMSLGRPAAPPATRCGNAHACCRNVATPAPASAPVNAPAANCLCMKLPASSLPASVVASPSSLTGASWVMATHVAAPPLVAHLAPSAALDVGSPPTPQSIGAHGLRAPPAA